MGQKKPYSQKVVRDFYKIFVGWKLIYIPRDTRKFYGTLLIIYVLYLWREIFKDAKTFFVKDS